MKRFDLLVIGSGPAGQRAAIQAAKLGKDVAIVDRRLAVGGVSVHTGTIPSKTIREAVMYLSGWRQRGFYGRGYRTKGNVTAADVMQRVSMTLNQQVEVMQHQLVRNGVHILQGDASFISPHQVQVTTDEDENVIYEASKIMVAVGTRPYRPDYIPFDGESILDSDDIVKIKQLPRNMTVIGGGVIGTEYATIFNALDIDVTLVEDRKNILEFVDREIIDEFLHHQRDNGMTLRLQEQVEHIKKDNNGRVITVLKSGKRLVSDIVLFAAGRMGATETLELDKAGLSADNRGRIKVNYNFQTDTPHIYAAGDVIGFPSLAATSMEQGRLAACHMFNHEAHSHPEFFPYGIYAVPEISMVGMTEKELREKNIPYECGVARIRETARGQIIGLREGIVKMLFALEDRRLLGVHIVGEGSTELIHIGQAVLSLGGKLDYFMETTFNYPTLAEAYKIAALNAWNRMSACQEEDVEIKPQPAEKIKAVK